MAWDGPIVDHHLHLDIDAGCGKDAIEAFVAAGGTHLFIVNKPSWWYGVEVESADDFRQGFDATLAAVEYANTVLPGRAWAVLGVHPALLTRLVEARDLSLATAQSLMEAGLDEAASTVESSRAIAVKSGRPHYPVDDATWACANRVLRHALSRAADVGCLVQLHTESGSDFTEIGRWARDAGLEPSHVIKHYADGPIEGLTPSVIARKDAITAIERAETPFFMETDYLDDPDRPGAVLGPKTVPRRVRWMAAAGMMAALELAHVTTPMTVYDVDTRQCGGT